MTTSSMKTQKMKGSESSMKRKLAGLCGLMVLSLSMVVLLATAAAAATINVPVDQPTIQAAVSVAFPGDTIQIAAGNYTETGQILVNKNLTITGAGYTKTKVFKAEDSGNPSSGDARGWILVTAGNTLNLSNLTLDGVGRKISIAVLSKGIINAEGCLIQNIAWDQPSYYGRGICVYGAGTSVVRRCNFKNINRIGVFVYGENVVAQIFECRYVGKGPGDWLDYAFETGGGGRSELYNCDASKCQGVAYDGSESAGVLVTTYFAPGTTASVMGGILYENGYSIAVGYDASDTSVVTANLCAMWNNSLGADNSSALASFDAENCWWGDNSGPTHSGNPGGIGDQVSDNIDYNPWYHLFPIDIGTTGDVLGTEDGHNLLGWGPIEPDTHGGGWGGMNDNLGFSSPDQKCRVTWTTGSDTSEASADFDTGIVSQDFMGINVLDGLGDDSFEVYVGPAGGQLQMVYSYVDQAPTWDDPEQWNTHFVDLSQVPDVNPLCVQVVSTAPAWQYFDPYGQLGVDSIVIWGKPTIPETMYWKDHNGDLPDGYMPDIDQKQDFNNDQLPEMHYCAPVAEANSLWWLAKNHNWWWIFQDLENGTGYAGGDLNHDGFADIKDLVQDLAIRMGTNNGIIGTLVENEQIGIDSWMLDNGLAGAVYEHTVYDPDFDYIEAEVKRCQDVKLDIGFWHVEQVLMPGFDDDGDQLIDEDDIDGHDNDGDGRVDEDPLGFGVIWKRVGGHAVTVAGVDSDNSMLAISDPYFDTAENGAMGVVRPEPQGHPAHPGMPTVHNVEAFASHDIYKVVQSISPGGKWALDSYPVSWPNIPGDLEYNNGPMEIVIQPWDTLPPVEYCMTFAEIEAAVIVSPVEPPVQVSIDPNSGMVDTTVNATINGSAFQQGATVKLTKQGQNDIDGNGTTTVNDTTITTSFDLTGAATGEWNVVVTNPDGGVCNTPVIFTVNAQQEPEVLIETNYAQWPRMQRDVTWDDYGHANYSGGVTMAAKWAGNSMTYTFTGTQLDIIMLKHTNRGKFKIYMDGSYVGEYDAYSPTAAFQAVGYTQSWATEGTHTLKIEVSGAKGAGTDTWIDVDAFDITSGGVVTRQESIVGRWFGTWDGYRHANYSGGSTMASKETGATCTYTFTGSKIEWIALKVFNRGRADVYIDNVLQGTVDCYSPTFDWQSVVYSKDFGATGTHTIKIVVKGTKNASSSDYWVDVDAFRVTP